MKTCKNCKYFTGIQCQGHGEYYGLCKRKKQTLIIGKEDTPCLQDIKTMRNLYFKTQNELEISNWNNKELKIYKLRYESQKRRANRYEEFYNIALKYISKENYKQFYKEFKESFYKFTDEFCNELAKLNKDNEKNDKK